jgi:hypothetical protein
MAGTGKLVISDTYLKDFAQQKLQGFIDSMTNDEAIKKLSNFASGPASNSSSGPDPSGTYHQLYPGNSKSGLNSAAQMQSGFKSTTGTLYGQIRDNLVTQGHQFQTDLINVDDVLNNSDDKANITAAEMKADLQNLNFGGSSSGGSGGGSGGSSGGGSGGSSGGGSGGSSGGGSGGSSGGGSGGSSGGSGGGSGGSSGGGSGGSSGGSGGSSGS